MRRLRGMTPAPRGPKRQFPSKKAAAGMSTEEYVRTFCALNKLIYTKPHFLQSKGNGE